MNEEFNPKKEEMKPMTSMQNASFNPSQKMKKEKVLIEKEVVSMSAGSILSAVLFGIVCLGVLYYVAAYIFQVDLFQTTIIMLGGILAYGISLFIAIRKKQVKEMREVDVPVNEVIIDRPVDRIVEKQVVVEKPVYQPVEKQVVVEKPVTRFIDRPVIRNVTRYIKTAAKKLNIPKYDFRGSTETKTYHTRNCRLGKLIKKKYLVVSNSENFFRQRRYKPCEECLKKDRKKNLTFLKKAREESKKSTRASRKQMKKEGKQAKPDKQFSIASRAAKLNK